jgi:hypothetical protein
MSSTAATRGPRPGRWPEAIATRRRGLIVNHPSRHGAGDTPLCSVLKTDGSAEAKVGRAAGPPTIIDRPTTLSDPPGRFSKRTRRRARASAGSPQSSRVQPGHGNTRQARQTSTGRVTRLEKWDKFSSSTMGGTTHAFRTSVSPEIRSLQLRRNPMLRLAVDEPTTQLPHHVNFTPTVAA